MRYTIYGIKPGAENRECVSDSLVAAKLHATAFMADEYLPTIFDQQTKEFVKL